MRTLGKQDLEDILRGATIMGSGGGGPVFIGEQVIEHVTKDPAKSVRVADPDADVPDDSWAAVSAGAGSPDDAKDGFSLDLPGKALDELAKLKNCTFSFILPGEVGAGNSFIPIAVVYDRGIPVIDASGADRAIPTLSQCTLAADGVPVSPLAMANADKVIAVEVPDAETADDVMRAVMSMSSFNGDAGIGLWGMDGKTMKNAVISDTLSKAQNLGRTLREASARGADQDPVEAVRRFLKGFVIAKGILKSIEETSQGGFEFGRVAIELDDGTITTLYNQNENLIAWNSGRAKPLAMAPDPIAYLTPDGKTFSNVEAEEYQGKEIVVIGWPADDAMRKTEILSAFRATLQGLGYAGEYVPIENLQG